MKSQVSRRNFLAFTAAIGAVGLAGCGNIVGQSGTEKAKNGILTFSAGVNASNQFFQNWNIYNNSEGVSAAPMLGLVLQPLMRISTDKRLLKPCLAESVEYSNGGQTATYKLRQDVTWNDGEKFNADDVIYSYNEVFGKPGPQNKEDIFKSNFLAKPVYKTDDYTVVCEYNYPNTQQDTNLALYYPILPEHIYGQFPLYSEGRKTFLEKDAIGTGPVKLKSFDPQRVVFEIRDDYWGGDFGDLKQIEVVPQGTVANVQAVMTKGDVDWHLGGGPGIEKSFVPMAKENQFQFLPDGSANGVLFKCNRAPFDNADLRRAFRDAVDPKVIRDSVATGYEIPTASGLTLSLYQEFAPDPYNKELTQDTASAKDSLAKSGFTVNASGNLEKDGKEYPLEILSVVSDPTQQVMAPMLVEQWSNVLGVKVKNSQLNDKVFETRVSPQPKEGEKADPVGGDFDLAIRNTNFGGSPYNAYQAYFRNMRGVPGIGNQGYWDIGVEGDKALKDLKELDPSDVEGIKKQMGIIAKFYADDAATIPFFSGGAQLLLSTKNWVGFPEYGSSDVDYKAVDDYSNAALAISKLKPAGS